jgi:hypothetical protein
MNSLFFICFFFFSVLAEIVEFFFVDTTPFVDKYFTEPKGDVYDWRGILPRKPYLSNLLKVVYSIFINLIACINKLVRIIKF